MYCMMGNFGRMGDTSIQRLWLRIPVNGPMDFPIRQMYVFKTYWPYCLFFHGSLQQTLFKNIFFTITYFIFNPTATKQISYASVTSYRLYVKQSVGIMY